MTYADLPRVNAILNTGSAGLLLLGYLFIRRKQIQAHACCMGGALLLSMLFLLSYVVSHAHNGIVYYHGEGPRRVLYFAILISHTILAIVIVPLIGRVLYLAAQRRFDAHRRLARWAFPLWLYVSITGVVIYRMLYL